ncbi:115R protein [Yaba-like disease virus]|uniref:Intermediate transcription factor 3 large subunit n=1 Tax=Yaba-like disease virus TaxID=132475 RepID=Q9DHJ8_YLDV|nr:115R protein [Yaba-like disease virus]CAC21353.1 115R protein [Yaba-like disease virus]
MDELFCCLREIEDSYSRTIFNFHLIKTNSVCDIYETMKNKISLETMFGNIVKCDDVKNKIKKLVYCDIHITKHIINPLLYPVYNVNNTIFNKYSNFFDINAKQNDVSLQTVEIFKRDKSSLISYVKTTNKKKKVDYGEIKKTVHGSGKNFLHYFSGKKSDEYMSTTIKYNETKPWIKSVSKRMRVDIINNSIITKGKSSILQTIEIVFLNRTCVKIFKDSTMHIILSKEKTELNCTGLIDKLFSVYKILFLLLYSITNQKEFNIIHNIANEIITSNNFEDKIHIIKLKKEEYGIKNFKIGMFNLTFIKSIPYTVFPSLLDNGSKIKFFKGKKLNIVAIKSVNDCKKYVYTSNSMLKTMLKRSNILHNLNIESASVDELKSLLS